MTMKIGDILRSPQSKVGSLLHDYFDKKDSILKTEAKEFNKTMATKICTLLKKEAKNSHVENLRLIFKAIVNLCDFDKPINLLLDLDVVNCLYFVYSTFDLYLTSKTTPKLERLFTGLMCTIHGLGSTNRGKEQLGKHFISILVHTVIDSKKDIFIRRQAAENVNLLLKNCSTNKKYFSNSNTCIEDLMKMGKSMFYAGDYAIQANIVELIFRMSVFEKDIETNLIKIFDDQEPIASAFKEIKGKSTFLEDIRNFLNFVNESQDSPSVYSLASSNISFGEYSTNPQWIDFGSKSISCFISYPGESDDVREVLDLDYPNIRTLRLGYKANRLVIQLNTCPEGFESAYDPTNNEQIIGISFSKEQLVFIKTHVAPIIAEAREIKKQFETKTSSVSNQHNTAPSTPKMSTTAFVRTPSSQNQNPAQKESPEQHEAKQDTNHQERHLPKVNDKEKSNDPNTTTNVITPGPTPQQQKHSESNKGHKTNQFDDNYEEIQSSASIEGYNSSDSGIGTRLRKPSKKQSEQKKTETKTNQASKRSRIKKTRSTPNKSKRKNGNISNRNINSSKEISNNNSDESQNESDPFSFSPDLDNMNKTPSKTKTNNRSKKKKKQSVPPTTDRIENALLDWDKLTKLETPESKRNTKSKTKSVEDAAKTLEEILTENQNSELEEEKEEEEEEDLDNEEEKENVQEFTTNSSQSDNSQNPLLSLMSPEKMFSNNDQNNNQNNSPQVSDELGIEEPPTKKRKISRRKTIASGGDSEIGDILTTLQSVISKRADEKKQKITSVSSKTSTQVNQLIENKGKQMKKQRDSLIKKHKKNITDIRGELKGISKQMKTAYSKFQNEIAKNIKKYSDTKAKLSSTKELFDEEFSNLKLTEEKEISSLDSNVRKEITKMEKEIKKIQSDEAISKLSSLLHSDFL